MKQEREIHSAMQRRIVKLCVSIIVEPGSEFLKVALISLQQFCSEYDNHIIHLTYTNQHLITCNMAQFRFLLSIALKIFIISIT